MAKKKPAKKKTMPQSALQWRVVRVHVDDLASALERLSAGGWVVFAVLGDPGNMTIVAKRMLTL